MKHHHHHLHLKFPKEDKYLHPGDTIRIGRFSDTEWVVNYGWFSYAGNRPWCGWYIVSSDTEPVTKPINASDLDDVYFIER